jgi:hypothetical protein
MPAFRLFAPVCGLKIWRDGLETSLETRQRQRWSFIDVMLMQRELKAEVRRSAKLEFEDTKVISLSLLSF